MFCIVICCLILIVPKELMNTMKPSITSHTAKTKRYLIAGVILMLTLAVTGLFVGKYPLSMDALLSGDEMQWRVFVTLRCSRAIVGVAGGFALGIQSLIQLVHRVGQHLTAL